MMPASQSSTRRNLALRLLTLRIGYGKAKGYACFARLTGSFPTAAAK
jgi:hypothetical protein